MRTRDATITARFDLAVKTGEMLGASAYVIGHRADRLARAETKPSARDRCEFTRMVEEKFEAAAESAAAMAPALCSLQARGAEIAARQMLAGLQAMMAVGRRSMLPRSSAAVSRGFTRLNFASTQQCRCRLSCSGVVLCLADCLVQFTRAKRGEHLLSQAAPAKTTVPRTFPCWRAATRWR